MSGASPSVSLDVLGTELVVCRLPADAPCPELPIGTSLFAVTRTLQELSVVCPTEYAPTAARVERGWRALGVRGPLDFGLTGILAALAGPLAAAGIAIFALSTYDTDYVLVRSTELESAVDVLRAAGHDVAAPAC